MSLEIRVASPEIFSQVARNAESCGSKFYSLCSRRLEVVGTRKNERARRRHAREHACLPRARPLSPSPFYHAQQHPSIPTTHLSRFFRLIED